MVQRVILTFVIVLGAASAAGKDNDKLRVCHFPASGNVQLLSIARAALPAHLDHGDIEAPPSVRTAADCLIPQPPPEPVAATATTDANGKASLLIPHTNVIARITATDAAGAAVAGATAQILVMGGDYLVMVADPAKRVAPAFAEGKLAEARPGSALQLAIRMVMQAFTTYFPGGAFGQPAPNFPIFVSTHFSVGEYCFTQQELQTFIGLGCNAALIAARSAWIAVVFTGGASFPIPFPGGRIRGTITIPSNMIRGKGTTGDCGRGDARVEIRVCPLGSGCTGSTWQGGHHIAICHDFTETLTFDILNPNTACSHFSFNAITEKPSTVQLEILPP